MAGPKPQELVRGGFGKLPTHPEFIRVNANGREVLALDQWVQEGLYHTRQNLGPRWEKLYDSQLFHRFVYRADNSGQTVVGVIRAAMDIHERRFPFTSFGLLPTQFLDARPLLIPTLCDNLYLPLEQTIEEAAGITALPAIKTRLQQSEVLPPPALALEERYWTFLDEVECGELGSFGAIPTDRMLTDLVATLAGAHEHPRRFTLSIELPLEQPPYARGLEIRFWIELCMILLKWYPPTLTLFWATGNPPPRRTTLLMSFRQAPGQLMHSLLDDSGTARGVWRPGTGQSFPGGGSRANVALPVREQDTLRSLLRRLCPGYPDVCRWYHAGA